MLLTVDYRIDSPEYVAKGDTLVMAYPDMLVLIAITDVAPIDVDGGDRAAVGDLVVLTNEGLISYPQRTPIILRENMDMFVLRGEDTYDPDLACTVKVEGQFCTTRPARPLWEGDHLYLVGHAVCPEHDGRFEFRRTFGATQVDVVPSTWPRARSIDVLTF